MQMKIKKNMSRSEISNCSKFHCNNDNNNKLIRILISRLKKKIVPTKRKTRENST